MAEVVVVGLAIPSAAAAPGTWMVVGLVRPDSGFGTPSTMTSESSASKESLMNSYRPEEGLYATG